MKLLFDQNISHKILRIIPKKYSDSSRIKKEGLINEPDLKIWEFAKANNYTIVTQDSDFNHLNSLFGFPPKIIWIRTGNLKTNSIAEILDDYSDEILKFIEDDNYGCFEIFSFKAK